MAQRSEKFKGRRAKQEREVYVVGTYHPVEDMKNL
jgi:hypothetical protein